MSGRSFSDADAAGAPPVAVVNQEFERRFYGSASAIGRRIRVFDSDGSIEIVGVFKNVREQGLVGRQIPVMYVPIAQANPTGVRASHLYFPMCWVVRTSTTGAAVERDMREALRAVDPKQPVSAFRTMEQVKDACERGHVDYVLVDTSRPVDAVLSAFLMARARTL